MTWEIERPADRLRDLLATIGRLEHALKACIESRDAYAAQLRDETAARLDAEARLAALRHEAS